MNSVEKIVAYNEVTGLDTSMAKGYCFGKFCAKNIIPLELAIFCSEVFVSVSEELRTKRNVETSLVLTTRNNDTKEIALDISKKGDSVGKYYDLTGLYNDFNGDVQRSCDHILVYEEKDVPFFVNNAAALARAPYDTIKNQLTVAIVSATSNKEMLNGIVWRPFLDMAIVPRIIWDQTNEATTSSLITTAVIAVIVALAIAIPVTAKIATSKYQKDVESKLGNADDKARQIIDDALAMANKNHPATIKSMAEVLSDMGMSLGPVMIDAIPPMYILQRDHYGAYGASAILDPDVLKNIHGENDLWVLPSSIHEMIVIPADGIDMSSAKELATIVSEVNASDAIKDQEVLSNSVYRYDYSTGVISIAYKG